MWLEFRKHHQIDHTSTLRKVMDKLNFRVFLAGKTDPQFHKAHISKMTAQNQKLVGALAIMLGLGIVSDP